MNKRQVILVILDGWGIGAKNETNPIYMQETPNIDYIKSNFTIGSLQASGISVGLPWNEEGNSEVGHLTIGAGKVLYQHYPRITLSIKDGTFEKKEAFLNAFKHAKENKTNLHLTGLLTESNIHSAFDHLVALIKLAKVNKVENIILDIISDGKDSKQRSVLEILSKLEKEVPNSFKANTISGRFYSMDRDKHWDRIKKAYENLIGKGKKIEKIEDAVNEAYAKDLSDIYIEPSIIDSDLAIKDNDSVIFFNFREERMRQLVSAFASKDFSEFPVEKFPNLYISTMTEYSPAFNLPVAYPPEKITDPLAKVLADNKKTQLHLAETEKYNHVTYFFNGYQTNPFPNEYRILIPSNNIANHVTKPEMKAEEITSRLTQAIREKSFDFVVANYANGDMIGHTADFDASKKAVKAIDDSIGKMTKAALDNDAILIITADHGNVEVLMDIKTGEPMATHDASPVPFYIVGNDFVKINSSTDIASSEHETIGILSDVAPTILELMNIPKPKEMTGESLLGLLR